MSEKWRPFCLGLNVLTYLKYEINGQKDKGKNKAKGATIVVHILLIPNCLRSPADPIKYILQSFGYVDCFGDAQMCLTHWPSKTRSFLKWTLQSLVFL